jgi:hypothetical protein
VSALDPAFPASFADFAITRRMELASRAVNAGDKVRALQLADAALKHAARLTLDCLTVQRIADVVVTLEDMTATPPAPTSPPQGAA